MTCCNDFGDCNQGRNCPVRVAKVGKRMYGPEPLQSVMWRYWVRRAGYWLLMAVLGLTLWPMLMYLALR